MQTNRLMFVKTSSGLFEYIASLERQLRKKDLTDSTELGKSVSTKSAGDLKPFGLNEQLDQVRQGKCQDLRSSQTPVQM